MDKQIRTYVAYRHECVVLVSYIINIAPLTKHPVKGDISARLMKHRGRNRTDIELTDMERRRSK